MKKNINNLWIIITTIFVSILIFLNKNLVFSTVNSALNIWINNLVPTLWPFFIVASILISYNAGYYLTKIFPFFKKLFKINDDALLVFFLSLFSGFPSNARNTRILYDEGLITDKEASKLLTFTHFSNPLFILGTVSVFFFHNPMMGYIILACHYLPNFIIGILFRNYAPATNTSSKISSKNNTSFGNILIKAITSSIDSLLLILGILTIFLIISSLIIHYLNMNLYVSCIVKSFLEITIGLKEISMVSLPMETKVILSSMILSFGGLSVHMQVSSQISGTKIKYMPFLCARIIHASLSGLFAVIYFYLFT